MGELEFRLLNDFQRDFPLVSEPYAAIARRLGTSCDSVLETLARLRTHGAVSRVGAVFRPNAIGASSLAAMAVPAGRLATVARYVSGFREVNHNYEREHRLNLWFVAAAPDAGRLRQVLRAIGETTGIEVLSLPLVEEFHIDLGFDLAGRRAAPGDGRALAGRRSGAAELPKRVSGGPPPRIAVSPSGQRLVAALQDGLDLVPRPFAVLAGRAGVSEGAVLETLAAWQALGLIRRFGVVVRHHELGFGANAMCVWDVPDAEVSAVGRGLADEPAVTLCYRRERAAPHWRYNLYCMLHGRSRPEVLGKLAGIEARHGLGHHPHAALFSLRRFKQTGARYGVPAELRHG
ncbi:MAG: Lrp/AsnC family transcriptional regulator [Burkholderiales bacterium]|nr:Lrp/AsnC family transcriptional regulator [Burkholderiales bacterium]